MGELTEYEQELLAEIAELQIKLQAAETERDAALFQLRQQNEKLDRAEGKF